MDKNTLKTIRILGLSAVSPTFRLLDIDRPISPHPQALHYAPAFFQIPDEILIEYANMNSLSPLSILLEKVLQEKGDNHINHSLSTFQTSDNGEILSKLRSIPPGSIQDQSFSLVITENSIVLYAFTDHGLAYGIGVLSQLIHQNQEIWVVQQVEILDYPTIPYRGITLPFNEFKEIPRKDLTDLLSSLLLTRMNFIDITNVEEQNLGESNVQIVQEFAENYFIAYNPSSRPKESDLILPFFSSQSHFPNLQEITHQLTKLSKNSTVNQKTRLLLNVGTSPSILLDRRNLLHGIGLALDWAWNPIDRPREQYYRAFYTELFGMHNPHLFADLIEHVSQLDALLHRASIVPLSKRKVRKARKILSIAKEMAAIASRTIIRHQEFLKAIVQYLDQIDQAHLLQPSTLSNIGERV